MQASGTDQERHRKHAGEHDREHPRTDDAAHADPPLTGQPAEQAAAACFATLDLASSHPASRALPLIRNANPSCLHTSHAPSGSAIDPGSSPAPPPSIDFLPRFPAVRQPSLKRTLFGRGDLEEPDDGILLSTTHRPDALPGTPWVMRQRWNDLLFAHWPVPAREIERLLPQGLTADTFEGSAWLGVVPFTMDQIQIRGLPTLPGANRFAELNLRTYVREPNTNQTGVYFFSLDATNPLAVAWARLRFHLPYYWARMHVGYGEQAGVNRVVDYASTRLLTRQPARFRARYRSSGQAVQGPAEHFLTARYSLYTTDWSGRLLRGRIHHLPWPLERAEAEFELNELPQSFGLSLPDSTPLLHYSRELTVYIWSLEQSSARRSSLSAVAVPDTL